MEKTQDVVSGCSWTGCIPPFLLMLVVPVVALHSRYLLLYASHVVFLTSALGLKELHILSKLYVNVF